MRTRLISACTVVMLLVSGVALAGAPSTAGAAASGALVVASSPNVGTGGYVDLSGAGPASFQVRPGVEQVTVTGAAPGARLTLLDASQQRILTLLADTKGQASFAYVPEDYLVFDTSGGTVLPTTDGGTLRPGTYRIVQEAVSPLAVTDPFPVRAVDDVPDPSLYSGQSLGAGFGYLTVRDGVQLSVMVRFPDPGLWGPGPYPTVVEYSGYSPSNPDSPEPGTMIADLLGFATVGVNIRGTGCSGGVFDVFNEAQRADGYDVIETIARQPWVKGGKVGMVGLSYSGITQLYVASARPPSLAAITPLSTIEDPWYQQWPGGVYNAGFTQAWLAERDRQAQAGGQSWVKKRMDGGDAVCTANQAIRSQNIDFEDFAAALEMRPVSADARRLSDLVRRIEVPVYLTGAWQDEQTGSRFATMLDDLTAAPVKKLTMFNGRHPDGYTPLVLSRWHEFLRFYVDRSIPNIPALIRFFAPPFFEDYFGVPGLGFEADRFASYPSYDAARAAYEAQPPVRVLFENGAGKPGYPGAPVATFARTFPAWPPPATTRTWYLGPDATLQTTKPATLGVDSYQHDPTAGNKTYLASGGAWDFVKPQISVDWKATPAGRSVSYVTPPLTGNVLMAGDGHVDLWLAADGSDVEVEVVLSEVYPDPDPTDAVPPKELIVQHGLLRASHRAVDTDRSSGTLIEHRFTAAANQPLVPGQFVNLQVPIYPVAHPFRAGSRLKLEINTPGRDDPIWSYTLKTGVGTTRYVARGGVMASKLVLPSVPAGFLPAVRPECGSLRGQVCRSFTPPVNTTVADVPRPLCGASTVGAADVVARDGRHRVATWDLGAARGDAASALTPRLPGIADALADGQVDVAAIQGAERTTPGGDTAALLAEALAQRTGDRWFWCWAQAAPTVVGESAVEGGGGPLADAAAAHLGSSFGLASWKVGDAVLSRLPIIRAGSALLPARDPADAPACTTAVCRQQAAARPALIWAELDGSTGPLVVATTDLAEPLTPATPASTEAQLRAAVAQLDQVVGKGGRVVLACACQAEPGSPTVQAALAAAFVDGWAVTRPGEPGPTAVQDLHAPAATVSARTDLVLTRGLTNLCSAGQLGTAPAVVDGTTWWPSTHLGVTLDLAAGSCASPVPVGGLVGDVTIGGKGIGGLNVVVRRAGPTGTVVARTTTGPTGRYRVAGLAAGQYVVRVVDPFNRYLRAWSGGALSPLDATPTAVGAGRVATADHLLVPAPPGRLAGTITETGTGTPLKAVLSIQRVTESGLQPFATTYAKADGTWAMPGLPEGQYRVYVGLKGYVGAWLPPGGASVAVGTGTTTLDGTLTPKP